MEQAKGAWPLNYRKVSIKMTDGMIIKGKINIKETGRLSTMFKTLPDNFLVLVPEDNSKKVFLINRTYILWAESEE